MVHRDGWWCTGINYGAQVVVHRDGLWCTDCNAMDGLWCMGPGGCAQHKNALVAFCMEGTGFSRAGSG